MKSTLAKTKLKETLDALKNQVKETEVEIEHIDNDIISLCKRRDNLDAEIKVIIGDILGLQAILGEEQTEDVSVKDVERENVPVPTEPEVEEHRNVCTTHTSTVAHPTKHPVKDKADVITKAPILYTTQEAIDRVKAMSKARSKEVLYILDHINDYVDGTIIDPVELTCKLYGAGSSLETYNAVSTSLSRLAHLGVLQKTYIGPNKFNKRRVANYKLVGAPDMEVPEGAYVLYTPEDVVAVLEKEQYPVMYGAVAERLPHSDPEAIRKILVKLANNGTILIHKIGAKYSYSAKREITTSSNVEEELPF